MTQELGPVNGILLEKCIPSSCNFFFILCRKGGLGILTVGCDFLYRYFLSPWLDTSSKKD